MAITIPFLNVALENIDFLVGIGGFISVIFIWRFFHWMERRPIKVKKIDMAKETAAREVKEAKENEGDHGRIFRIGNLSKGRIVGSRTYWRILPTKFGNPTH